MRSPVAKIRRGFGLSQHDFAVFAGVGLSTLVAVESGALKPNGKVLQALEAFGADTGAVEEAQRRYVAAKRKVIGARLRPATTI